MIDSGVVKTWRAVEEEKEEEDDVVLIDRTDQNG